MYISWLQPGYPILYNPRWAMPKLLCQMLAQRLHTTTFGRMVPGRKEVNRRFPVAACTGGSEISPGNKSAPRPERWAFVDITLAAPVTPVQWFDRPVIAGNVAAGLAM